MYYSNQLAPNFCVGDHVEISWTRFTWTALLVCQEHGRPFPPNY